MEASQMTVEPQRLPAEQADLPINLVPMPMAVASTSPSKAQSWSRTP